jgi:hypothetical protein
LHTSMITNRLTHPSALHPLFSTPHLTKGDAK